MGRRSRRLLLTAAVVLLLVPAGASAATRYVTTSGSGSSCTQTAPCGTIRAAYGVAGSGDTIQLASGTYPSQGSYQDPTIRGTKTVTVLGGAGVKVRQIAMGETAANVTFDGIDVDGGGTNPGSQLFDTGGGHDITFRNGRIGNVLNQKGAQAGGDSNTTPLNIVFDNVEFHDVMATGDTHNECIYSQAPGITIKNSVFRGVCGNTGAVFFTRGTWWSQPCYGGFTILNNHFERQQFDHGALIWTTDVGCGFVDDAVIRGNTFDGPGVANTGPVTYRRSVESCNSPAVEGQGLVHEPCGPTPEPTPTPTPAPSPAATPTATATPEATPTSTPAPTSEPGCDQACEQAYKDRIGDLETKLADLEAKIADALKALQ